MKVGEGENFKIILTVGAVFKEFCKKGCVVGFFNNFYSSTYIGDVKRRKKIVPCKLSLG